MLQKHSIAQVCQNDKNIGQIKYLEQKVLQDQSAPPDKVKQLISIKLPDIESKKVQLVQEQSDQSEDGVPKLTTEQQEESDHAGTDPDEFNELTFDPKTDRIVTDSNR